MYKYNVGILTPVRLQAGRMAENGNTVQKLRHVFADIRSEVKDVRNVRQLTAGGGEAAWLCQHEQVTYLSADTP